MAAKQPWMKFYPSDWRADQALRVCSLAARGLWLECMCIMHEAKPYGHLMINGRPVTDTQLSSLTGVSLDQINNLLVELEDAGVFSRTGAAVIYSRRMTRDDKKARMAIADGTKGGSPKLKGDYNLPGFIYLIGPRKDGRIKIGVSVNPANRLKKIRAQYRGQNLRVIRQWNVDDMGTLERTLHRKFAKNGDGEWFSLSRQDIEIIDGILDPKGGPKGDPKGDPFPQKPESRIDSESDTSFRIYEKDSESHSREGALGPPGGGLSLPGGSDPPSPTDYAALAFKIWLEVLGDVLPKPRKLDHDRRARLRTVLAKSFGNDLGRWRGYCQQIRGSPFLTGSNDRGWRADIDFTLKDKSIRKVEEGSFNSNENGNRQGDARGKSLFGQYAEAYGEDWQSSILDISDIVGESKPDSTSYPANGHPGEPAVDGRPRAARDELPGLDRQAQRLRRG